MVISNMFKLSYLETMILVIGKSLKYFKGLTVDISNVPKYFEMRVTIQANDAGVRRQVDAVNLLCKGTNMNHSSRPPIVNPVECLQVSLKRVDKIRSKILNCD